MSYRLIFVFIFVAMLEVGCSQQSKLIDIKNISDGDIVAIAEKYTKECQYSVTVDRIPEIIKGQGVIGVYYDTNNLLSRCVIYIEESGTIEVNTAEKPSTE